MSRLRTSLVALAVGGIAVSTGAVVASNASAAPPPVEAVNSLAGTQADATTDGAARPTPRGWWKGLTDEQRSCLQDAKSTRPVGRLDDAERQALRSTVEAAAATCGVELPFAKKRAFWNGLADDQQTCLKDAAVNRPWGPKSAEQRQAVRTEVRAAAATCGITLPAKG